jgi:uncharacterized protein (TIGR02246 family)
MKNQVGVAVLTAIVVTAGAVFTATKSDADLLRQARDREEIEQLMWRYARALDTADADGYAANYTVDGQFGTGANATKGREALKKMIAGTGERQAAAKRPPMYHMTANHQITFIDKDHARIDAYHLTWFSAAGPETPARIAGVGRSIDELERVNGQWLIKTRNVAPMD